MTPPVLRKSHMNIVLRRDAGRGAWSPTTNAGPAQVGGAVVGPRGLPTIVETALEMRGPTQPTGDDAIEDMAA